MTHKRTRYSAEFKAKVALEATKDINTLNELAAKYGIHPAQISQWKKQLLDGLSIIFSTQKKKTEDIQQLDDLYRQIGEVTVQRDWLKKKTDVITLEVKRGLIEPAHHDLTIQLQCDLLGLPRSTIYYESHRDDTFNIMIMKEIDKLYTAHPDYGKRRMSIVLREKGLDVGTRLARSLMKQMGLEAIGPKPSLSKPHPSHKIYPYGLRGIKIAKPNQVWSTDITYLPMRNGFLYLTAVIDWYSRYILSWKLSNSLDGLFCREVLIEALEKFGRPEWFNTDQGAQYTCLEFIHILETNEVQISMDGRGRALDEECVAYCTFSERLNMNWLFSLGKSHPLHLNRYVIW